MVNDDMYPDLELVFNVNTIYQSCLLIHLTEVFLVKNLAGVNCYICGEFFVVVDIKSAHIFMSN